jgi:hypothetical protein
MGYSAKLCKASKIGYCKSTAYDRMLKWLDKITKARTADNNYIVWIATCSGLSGAFAGTGEEIMDVLSVILTIASGILYIIWAFRAKKHFKSMP